jgi:8-oxo-dGTP diphosphatase
MSEPITVLAAVIERDGRFLLARRLKGTHPEGLWEFPGGKCDPGDRLETVSCARLGGTRRQATVGGEIIAIDHAYPDRTAPSGAARSPATRSR